MKSFQRIVMATDFSPSSRKAFETAVQLASDLSAELWIANACLPPSYLYVDVYLTAAVYEELDSKLRENAARQVQELVEEAQKSGVEAHPVVVSGLPADTILEAAATNKANLIVMGTHGRTGAARLFLGSVAARVVATAPCPVLTVRGS